MGTDSIMAEAIDWHLRQADLTDAEWLVFVAWLESPANAHAYDRVATADRLLAGAARPAVPALPPLAANDVDPCLVAPRPGARRWGWSIGGLAMAACLAVLAMPFVRAPAAQPYWIATQPGEHRTVALTDGTRIDLNGGTRLGLDRADPRVATLQTGEAVFHVRHDGDHPFSVRSGDLTVRDVGTVFDVARTGPRLDVAVAEGEVLFQPDRDRIALTAGQAITAREDRGEVVRSTLAPDLVGGWRDGHLAFTGEPLDAVMAAVHRRYGVDVALDPGLSGRSFTGMVAMSGTADRDIPHLAALIGATWRRKGDRWILAPEGGTAR